jgi:redox-sensitive bicupin YhaK (pirin superfamily)
MNTTQTRIQVLRAAERGRTQRGWLDGRHSFSFGEYFDPQRMGFRSLRVINDDRVAAGGGFPTHPHRDMEILTYIIDGELAHRDSMGNGRTIKAGELQAMTAGTGITHSEFNPSADNPTHLLQIWIVPNARGLTPEYSEWKPSAQQQELTLLASPNGDAGVLIHQDAKLYLGELEAGKELEYATSSERGLWLQVIEGAVEVDGETLHEADGAAIEGTEVLTLRANGSSKFLLFDLA